MTYAPDYITTAELKSYVEISDTNDDVQLAVAITAASRAIDDYCNRQFGQLPITGAWAYEARPDLERGRWVVDIDDLMTQAGLLVEVPTVDTVTLYALEPVNAAPKSMPWTRIVIDPTSSVMPVSTDLYAVHVTAQFGWSAVPTPVKQATYLQASRFFSRRKSPYGIAGSPDQGNELRLLSRVDPDVAVSLRGYVRPRGVG